MIASEIKVVNRRDPNSECGIHVLVVVAAVAAGEMEDVPFQLMDQQRTVLHLPGHEDQGALAGVDLLPADEKADVKMKLDADGPGAWKIQTEIRVEGVVSAQVRLRAEEL